VCIYSTSCRLLHLFNMDDALDATGEAIGPVSGAAGVWGNHSLGILSAQFGTDGMAAAADNGASDAIVDVDEADGDDAIDMVSVRVVCRGA
jgi:hypothetical protein